MTKKSVLRLSIIGSLIFLTLVFISLGGYCTEYKYLCDRAHDDTLATYFFVFLLIFFISLITYKMRDEIFLSWLKFTYVWVPLTIVLTFLAPEYGNSLLPIEKGSVSFVMSFLFLLISLIIIISKSISLRKK